MNHAQMVALGRMLRVLGESGDELRGDTPEEALHEIRADLKRALDLLEESTGPAPTTRCSQHPYGPVDKAAPDGCLLCETRRRSNHRSAYRDRWGGAPADEAGDRPLPVPSRYGIAADTPEPMVRWRPEAWSGQAWQLCGTPAGTSARRNSSWPPAAARPTGPPPTGWCGKAPPSRSYGCGASRSWSGRRPAADSRGCPAGRGAGRTCGPAPGPRCAVRLGG